jgi:hypothetical protein
MKKVDYNDLEQSPESTISALKAAASNAVELGRLLQPSRVG